MDIATFAVYASHLLFGAFSTFCAIILWSRTRDMAWTLVIIGAIVAYADIVFVTLEQLHIVEAGAFAVSGIPVARIALDNLPLFFSGVGFLVAMSRRRLP